MNKTYSLFFGIGGSGNIRGIQVADFLGGKKNPREGYENDICIYVKGLPPVPYPKMSYMDVDDSVRAVEFLKAHPDLKVIAISELARTYLAAILRRYDIIYIPHQHCNYDNWIRPDREVKTVGIIGCKTSFMYPVEEIRKKLAEMGLELKYEQDYWTHFNNEPNEEGRDSKEKVLNFYKKIDIQIVWRKRAFRSNVRPLKSPSKLSNAGSCRIPTVSYPEASYMKEWPGAFVPVNTIEDMLAEVKKLKEDSVYYNEIADRALERSKEYHVDRVKELYLNL